MQRSLITAALVATLAAGLLYTDFSPGEFMAAAAGIGPSHPAADPADAPAMLALLGTGLLLLANVSRRRHLRQTNRIEPR